MKSLFTQYTGDELWLIKETEFSRSLQSIREAQFALGNGYLGTRGIYEEIPYDCSPGTYIAGCYDKMSAQVSELVNLPNPINFKFTVEGEKLDVVAMDILEHRRVLNLKKGVLVRRTLYKDSKERRYEYQSLRFISMHDKNIGVVRIELTPLDAACTVDINSGIDISVSNAGVLSEGNKKHYRVKELGQNRGAGYVVLETTEKKHTIVYWAGFYYQVNGKKVVAEDNIFRLKIRKNQSVVFTKVFCVKHFPRKNGHTFEKEDVFKIFNRAFRAPFLSLLGEHANAWEKLWRRTDIVIGGTANIQQNLRFNIYHMLACAHADNGASSIGARTMSGEGYRGHVFWDADIFLFPFYLFTMPKIARNMLLYRYRRLPAAKAIAASNGYRGAQFAWESADTGEEETPGWARDLDRSIIKIHTQHMEQHITADVAYALYKYYVVTGDEKFMQQYGYEMFVEIARFWASRAQWNSRKKQYDISHIIGPDEFHVDIDNNAFTNMMAKWVLITAAKLLEGIKKKGVVYTRLKKKTGLKGSEARQWKGIASKMAFSITKKKVIEQFDGYFKLRKVALNRTDENGIPLIPVNIKPRNLGKTQVVKQADVLMLLMLLDDVFNIKTKTANYDFYIMRTVHKSSLSAPVHAFMACKVRDLHRAYNFFNVSLRTDISNLYGNTHEGIHAASLGGTWQALVFGFAGISLKRGIVCIDPHMPRSWQKLIFPLMWRGIMFRCELEHDIAKVRAVCGKKKKVTLCVFNKYVTLQVNKVYVFKRGVHEYPKQEYY